MDIEASTVRHVTRRLLPFLALCFFVSYIDRVGKVARRVEQRRCDEADAPVLVSGRSD